MEHIYQGVDHDGESDRGAVLSFGGRAVAGRAGPEWRGNGYVSDGDLFATVLVQGSPAHDYLRSERRPLFRAVLRRDTGCDQYYQCPADPSTGQHPRL